MNRIGIAVISAVISWFAYYWTAQFFDSSAPAFMASIILLSIVIHELGHWAAMEFYGIRAGVIFLVIMGGAFPYPMPKDPKKGPADKLTGSQYSVLTLAGVAMNFVLIGLSGAAFLLDLLPQNMAMSIINMNAMLILWNLIPFGPLDGGKFTKRFFDGVPEHRDMLYATRIAAAVVGSVLIMSFITGKVPFLAVFLLTWGLRKKATTDDPMGSMDPLAMNTRQENFWAFVYGAMFIASLVISYTTPDWPM